MTLTMERRSWQVWLVVATMVLALVLVLGAAAMLLWPHGSETVEPDPKVTLEMLPVGAGYPIEVPGYFDAAPPLPIKAVNPAYLKPSPVPVMLFRDESGEVRAFYQRDPRSGCLFPWIDAEQLFIDPCHGSAYTRTGERVWGPAQRGLDQFGVVVGEDGEIKIDLDDYRLGPAAR